MKIKSQITFQAKDEAEALHVAGERLGRDAVLLSTQVMKVGGFLGFFRKTVLKVTAAILEEERKPETDTEKKERLAAFQKLLDIKKAIGSSAEGVSEGEKDLLDGQKIPSPASPLSGGGVYSPLPRKPSAEKEKDIPEELEDRTEISPRGRALAAEKPSFSFHSTGKLQQEVDEISQRLDRVLKRLETERYDPAPALPRNEGGDLVSRLLSVDVCEVHARSLVQKFRENPEGKDFVTWLGARISTAANNSWDALGGKRVMVVGPTGVGKTTTIAKLAAIHALWEKKNILLLTADTYRIAAVEQLRTYAKILGVPMDVIYEAQEIPEILAKHGEPDLVLLDTAGRSQRDTRRLEELRALYDVFLPDTVHLALPANMKYRDMLDVVERMGVVPLSHIIFTKLDETTTYGALLNILLDFARPASFFTMGQNVPNDIEVASGMRLAEMLLKNEGGTLRD
ncbi:MAG: flagellar biosynthesis protein FlhF [Synergistaceae bacterium]|nr:flagellar biosynthesis protein FlhF [Synergistaceae bacterium]